VHALRDITLSIPHNAFTAIMGPSGSGKSTLLHCLAALDTPTSGRVFLGGTELTSLTRRQQAQVRRDRIGFVFQAFNLVPTLDAIENITLPQQLAGRRPNSEWLEYVVSRIGLADRLHHRPSQLSGGQQQRVALARALAGRPEVIFADEPTGNLDTRSSREMMSLLRSAVDDFRQTVVTVTHDPAIAGYADQVLFFTDGQVVDQVLHPEPDLVLQHLRYLDFSAPAHRGSRGQLHASSQPDGQDMRSRRRRRADETGPGRPMVGSDDEVEVARQERWLQRIREQFEVEQEATNAHDDYSDGYHPDTTHHTSNGYHPDTTHHTSNGYHPDTTHLTSNGLVTTGANDVAPDDGWLPPVRSWLSDTGSAAGVERADTSRHDDLWDAWSEPAPVVDTHQARLSVRRDADVWRTDDWDRSSQETRPDSQGAGHDERTSADLHADSGTWRSTPPPEDTAGYPDAVIPIRSWREERTRSSDDDLWPNQSASTQDEWPTAAPMKPTSGHWDTPGPSVSDSPAAGRPTPDAAEPAPAPLDTPETNGWQPHTPETNGWQPHTPETNGWRPYGPESRADPTAPEADGDRGWQRWRPDTYAATNGGTPASNGQHNAEFHDEPHNGRPPTGPNGGVPNGLLRSHQDEEQPDPQRNGRLDAPRRQHVRNDTNNWGVGESSAEIREVDADDQPPHASYPPNDDGASASSEQPEIVDPVRELLDIWSPNSTSPDDAPASPADDRQSAGWASPADPGSFEERGSAIHAADRLHRTETFGSDPQEPPSPLDSAAPPRGGVSAAPHSPDEWQSHTDPPADHRRDRPPRRRSSPGYSTDPFDALHSLQSQLNRLGGGRRPRRYPG
jgi:putative ABC transport system ATP-binding protein